MNIVGRNLENLAQRRLILNKCETFPKDHTNKFDEIIEKKIRVNSEVLPDNYRFNIVIDIKKLELLLWLHLSFRFMSPLVQNPLQLFELFRSYVD